MKTIYYNDFSDNFVETKNQEKKVPDNYQFIKTNPLAKFLSTILFCFFKFIGRIYAIFVLGLKIEGKYKLKNHIKSTRSGYYIYANHVLTYGDVYNPALYSPVHPYYICDSSNLGIPILGPILPFVGALPIPDSIKGKKRLFDAISTRAKQGNAIVIYPEAHVWPYYTNIRPFDATAFAFPARDNLPIFTATTTFMPRKFRKKPRAVIYIDGPFSAPEDLNRHEKSAYLHDKALSSMQKHAKRSTVKYINYKKRES